MSEKNPKIIAESSEEFDALLKKVNELPFRVRNQIETVEKSLLGIKCKIKNSYSKENIIFLPAGTSQIKDFGDFIGVYTSDFYFEIGSEIKNSLINYIILQPGLE